MSLPYHASGYLNLHQVSDLLNLEIINFEFFLARRLQHSSFIQVQAHLASFYLSCYNKDYNYHVDP